MGVFDNIGSPGWDAATYWLYIAVAAIAGMLSWMSMTGQEGETAHRGRLFPFAAAMGLLVIFKGLCVSTVDVKGGYYLNFQSATSFEEFRDWTLEPLYQALNVLVRNITSDYGLFLMVVALFTIIPIGYIIWKCRDFINVPFAVIGYALVYLMLGMSVMRQFIAVSFIFVGTYYWVFDKRRVAIIWTIIALGFHISSLSAVLLYALLSFRDKIKIQIILSICVVAAAILGRSFISVFLTGRYSAYGAFDQVSFGIAVVLKYVPLFLLVIFVYYGRSLGRVKASSDLSSEIGLCCAVLLFAVVSCLLGYVVSIFGRIETYSVAVVMVIAHIVRRCEEERYFRLPVKGLVILYFLFRFTMQMNDYYLLDGLMPYITSFGLEI